MRNMSRGVNHPTPGIVAFSAPGIRLLGKYCADHHGIYRHSRFPLDGPVPKALFACVQGVSSR